MHLARICDARLSTIYSRTSAPADSKGVGLAHTPNGRTRQMANKTLLTRLMPQLLPPIPISVRIGRDKSRHEAERKARHAPAPTGQPCLISLPHDGDIVPKGSVHRQTGISPCLKNALDPLESLARFSRASKGLTPRFSPLPTRNHPESSSNSICRSPHSSFGQFHPRHLPCRTKSHLRPSAIA